MNKMTKLLLTAALLVGAVGVNSVKAETVITKTPIILTGGGFAECFTPGTYIIQMQGWQNFIVYEDAEGVAFDEDSYMQFDMAESCSNGSVRVTFTFSDNSTTEQWWCLGIGESASDASTPYGHVLDNSKYWLKKGLGDDFETKKGLKITKITVNNFNPTENEAPLLVTYKINGGTICGQPMTIKNGNTKAFGAYGGVFTATAAQTNIFKMENFEVGDYQKIVFKFGQPVPSNGGWAYNYQSGVYPPSITVGATELEIPLNGTALPEITIFNWDANPDPINISEVYFYKEEEEYATISFDDYGSATVDKKYLTATGGLSYDTSTGVLTSDGTAGTLVLELASAVDLSILNTFNTNRSGNSNIVNCLKFYDSENNLINTWNNAKWDNAGLDYNATYAFKTHNPVKKLVWESDVNDGNNGQTLTISGLRLQLKTIGAMKGTDITTLPYKLYSADGDNDATVEGDATPTKNIGVVTGGVVFGSDNINDSKKYVDLTNYKKLIIRGYGTIRLFYNWVQDPQGKPETSLVNNTTTVQTLELNIPEFMTGMGISHFHLVGIKPNWGGQLFVESISVVDGTEKYDYTFAGRGGLILPSAAEALADNEVTAIDATPMTIHTSFKEILTPANPNCLIAANADQLTNTQNVIVGGTCANLVLTDGHPFKAPTDFTATAASYSTTINATAQAGTLCLPFAAAVPDGVEAYTLTYSGGDLATATAVETTIPANTPVLLNGSGAVAFTGSGAVSASAENVSGALTGVFASTAVPTGSYVLQNGDNGIGFYRVDASDPITAPSFRAYLTATSSARSLRIVFDAETTGVNATLSDNGTRANEIYNLCGQRVSQPKKGLYIVNGKKTIRK